MLNLQTGPNHVLIYSLNSVIDFKGFTKEGSWFHILKPKATKCFNHTLQTCDV